MTERMTPEQIALKMAEVWRGQSKKAIAFAIALNAVAYVRTLEIRDQREASKNLDNIFAIAEILLEKKETTQ